MSKVGKTTILIATITYKDLTGVELYVYELSRELVAAGARVIIVAPEIGGEITEKSESNGVEVYNFETCPDSIEPNILHVNEPLPTMYAMSRWPKVPVVATIHSQFAVEKPVISKRISKYICIREEIQEKLINEYGIEKNRTQLIYNGFNFDRFSQDNVTSNGSDVGGTILFIGTIDPLRRKSIEHLVAQTAKTGKKLIVAGKKYDTYLDNIPDHVSVLSPRWDVESLLHLPEVEATAGVLLGRTTIEGWIANKPGIIYDIDLDGNIVSVDTFEPPADLQKFNSKRVAEKIYDTYLSAIKDAREFDYDNAYVDLSATVSQLVSRSTTQGIMLYNVIKRIEKDEGRIDSLELGSTSLHERMANAELHNTTTGGLVSKIKKRARRHSGFIKRSREK